MPTYSGYSGYGQSSGTQGPSVLQLLTLMELQKRRQQGGFGSTIWDIIKGAGKGAGSIVGGVFNILMRPTWASASMVDELLNSKNTPWSNPLTAYGAGLAGKSKVGFGEVLRDSGILTGHDFTRGVAGFTLDVLGDPTTYAGLFAGPPGWAAVGAKQGAKLGFMEGSRAAAKAASKLGSKQAVDLTRISNKMLTAADDVSAAEYARQFMDVYGPTAADVLDTSLEKFAARKGLAEGLLATKNVDEAAAKDLLAEGSLVSQKAMARAEFKDHLRRAGLWEGGVRYKLPFLPEVKTPTFFHARKLPIGEKNIPVISALARHGGGTFLPDYMNKTLHAAKMATRHRARRLQEAYSNVIREAERVPGSRGLLTRGERIHAVDWAANKADVVINRDWEKGVYGDLNTDMIQNAVKAGELSADEANFLGNVVYRFGKHMWEQDMAYKIPYEKGYSLTREKGYLYVPEPFKPKILGRRGGRTVLTEAPYQKIKKSVRTSADMVEQGFSEKELDPLNRMLGRARSAGQKHADATMFDAVTKTFGQPMKLPDYDKMQSLQTHIDEVVGNRDNLWAARVTHEKMSAGDRGRMLFGGQNQMVKDELDRLTALPSVRKGLAARANRVAKAKYPATKKKAQADLDKYVKDLRKRAKDRVTKKLYPELRARHLKKYDQLTTDYVRSLKKLDNAARGLDNPNRALLQEVKDIREGGHLSLPFTMPDGSTMWTKIGLEPDIKEPLARMEKALIDFQDDEFAQITLQRYDKFLSQLRMFYTVWNPGYRIRNTVSDMWAMWLSGMGPVKAIHWGMKGHMQMRSATQALNKAARGEALTKAEQASVNLVNEAYDLGILAGFFEGDAALVRRLTSGGSRKKGHFWTEGWQPREGAGVGGHAAAAGAYPFRAYQEAMVNMNSAVENSTRLGHYLYKRSQGMPAAEAAEWVKLRHFDYEDLTTSELRFGKKVALFYTWTRKNLPYQIAALANEPGRYAAFPKMIMEGEQAAGDSQGEVLPDFLKEGFAFKTPGLGYVNPAIGAVDLRLLPERLPGQEGGAKFPIDQWMELINPIYRVPWEVVSNTNLRTGGPIAGEHPRNPVGSEIAAVLGNTPILSSLLNFGPTERRVGNEIVTGPGVSPWASYGASQVPLLNLIFNQRSNIRQKQRQGNAPVPLELLSWLGGVSAFNPNQEQMLNVQEALFSDQMNRMIRGLRDEDRLPEPDPRSMSDYELLKLALLKSVYGRPGG